MERNYSAGQVEPEIFALSLQGANSFALRHSCEMSRASWVSGNGMKDMNAADSTAFDEWPQSPRDCFYFRQFRHIETAYLRITGMA